MLSAALYADLLTVPWKRGGRDRSGLDCVGLFLELQRRIGRKLPAYASEEGVLAIAKLGWCKVVQPKPGDAVLLHSLDPAWHLGTVLGEARMIHAKDGAGVVVERYDAPQYARRIEGFYLFKESTCVPSA